MNEWRSECATWINLSDCTVQQHRQWFPTELCLNVAAHFHSVIGVLSNCSYFRPQPNKHSSAPFYHGFSHLDTNSVSKWVTAMHSGLNVMPSFNQLMPIVSYLIQTVFVSLLNFNIISVIDFFPVKMPGVADMIQIKIHICKLISCLFVFIVRRFNKHSFFFPV